MASPILLPRVTGKMLVAACLSVATVLICATVTAAHVSVQRQCNADFAGWGYCTSDGIQYRNNINCPHLYEARECTAAPSNCGGFSRWDPPLNKCEHLTVQKRRRVNCARRVEARTCVTKFDSTNKEWSDWSTCQGTQTRTVACSNLRESRECGDKKPQCGGWTEWWPPLEAASECKPQYIYYRERENCPDIEELKVCGETQCPTACSPHGYCHPLEATCYCNEGYTGDGITCKPLDPCQHLTCGPHSTCVPNGYEAQCVCNAGYGSSTGSPDTENVHCVDVDECAQSTHSCPAHSDCVNSEGSYTCNCRVGFSKLESGGPHGTCEDIDECAAEGGADLCGTNATCVNTAGTYECKCHGGYRLDSNTKKCVDIDECAAGTACSSNAICTNTDGGFACQCPAGYRGLGSPESPCHKIDYCSEGKHDCAGPAGHSTCVNEEVGFKCVCDEGYKGSGKIDAPCVDIDECDKAAPRHDCDSNAVCANTDGSFECHCNTGFTGTGKGQDTCADDDECATGQDNCADVAVCTNTKGSFTCACPEAGYTGDGVQCTDIDECEKEGACHQSATCTNLPGSYTCECLPGFSGNGHQCTDVDECAEGTHTCGMHAQCTNIPGAYTCQCDTGYHLPAGSGHVVNAPRKHGGERNSLEPSLVEFLKEVSFAQEEANQEMINCVDVDECTDKTMFPENSICNNTDGSYTWTCRPGYEQKSNLCQKINYCSLGHCSPLATCHEINEGTDFECVCVPGYRGNGRGESGCSDIDECKEKHACASDESGGVCTNTVGSYVCGCKEGYRLGANNSCEDIDECSLMSKKEAAEQEIQLCDTSATCTNTRGSYECNCNSGYSGDGFSCSDIDECAAGTHTCGSNSKCVNTPGAFTCVCDEGFMPSGSVPAEGHAPGPFSCKDIDECATAGAEICSPFATCSNTVGSYTCTCKPGYEGTGKECSNIEFCSAGRNDCDANADCDENAEGTDYYCKCRTGYEGSGHTSRGAKDGCKDINECERAESHSKHICAHPGGVCTNVPGSYTCSCTEAFTAVTNADGSVGCHDVDECAEPSRNDCTPPADGGGCQNTVGSYKCFCLEGFKEANEGKECTDIDECASAGACSDHATCVNTKGGYSCKCDAGYRLQTGSTRVCEDINECTEQLAHVPPHGSCVNFPGGYDFTCDPGYERVARSGAKGGDTSPHSDVVAGENKGHGYICQKIDFCAREECHPRAICAENAAGTDFTCTCPNGYSTHNNGKGPGGCQDVDECAEHICSSYGTEGVLCTNTEGSYECSCKEGYFMQQPEEQIQAKRQAIRTQAHRTTVRSIAAHGTSLYESSASLDSERQAFIQLRQELAALENNTQNRCVDIDECMDSTLNTCAREGGRCTNTPGGFKCSCITGYEQHGDDCTDIDECERGDACPANATCTNTPGSFECTCHDGYKMENHMCHDIDECSTSAENDCDTHRANCTNTIGSYTCECLPGFEGDGITCTNRDECATGTDDCPANSKCTDSVGSYDCTCEVGYEAEGEKANGDPIACVDTDECKSTDACPSNATCTNTPGGFSCTCNEGFRSSGVEEQGQNVIPISCDAIDFCAEEHPCSPHASCENAHGEAVCTCNVGYEGDGRNCTDIDECENATHQCDSHATCVNLEGSYDCECHPGFMGDGKTCDDLDECATGEANCDPNALCTNVLGSFTCACKTGYMGNGNHCVSTEVHPDQLKCHVWSPWTECKNGKRQRHCVALPSKIERVCCRGAVTPVPPTEGEEGKPPETLLPQPGGEPGEAGKEEEHEEEIEERCGPWLDWSGCPGAANNLTSRKREKTDTDPSCKNEYETLECPDAETEAACGQWRPYSPCGVPVQGMQVSVREHCPQEAMYAECTSTGPPPPSADGSCTAWGPWEPCVSAETTMPEEGAEISGPLVAVEEQKRKCLNADMEESRLCNVEGEGGVEYPPRGSVDECALGDATAYQCGYSGGNYTEWSACQNHQQNRHLEDCPDLVETRQCVEGTCPPFGEWTKCGALKPGLRTRMRENCTQTSGCNCMEMEVCAEAGLPPVERPPTEVPPEEGVPPTEEVPPAAVPPAEEVPPAEKPAPEVPPAEEKEEEGGMPTAAIAGGIVGGVLLLGAAGGGAAYMMKGAGGAPTGEAEQVVFEGETGEGAGEEQPESETVIEIEDDAWADMD